MDALRHWDGLKWSVYAIVVLPDHVHILAQPLPKGEKGAFDLAEIIHSVKSFSSQKINQLNGNSGSLWQDERYDRIVRDEAEFLEKWQYIRNNPVKEALAAPRKNIPGSTKKAHNAQAGSLCHQGLLVVIV